MAKKKSTVTEAKPSGQEKVSWNEWLSMRSILNATSTMSRDALLRTFPVRAIDMDYECRWPTTIAAADYKSLFERNALAGRVATIWPSECWILPPEIYEEEDAEQQTAFEKAWDELNKDLSLLSELYILDILSGVGRFGLMVFGLSDLGPNEDFSKPVEGIDLATGEVSAPLKLQVLYVRSYQEADVEIVQWDQDKSHKRYGQPVLYSVTMEDPGNAGVTHTERVHFTRVLHILDNRLTSRVYGEPRMKPVYNDLLDAMKVKGGASEGYWRACLSGIAWGLDPQLMRPDATVSSTDQDTIKEELENYYNGMQRYLVGLGLVPHDIAPKLIDPSPYLDALIKLICVRINVPVPIFVGREEGKLAADENRQSWLERVVGRQNNYLTPFLLKPFIAKLQAYGALPPTAEEPEIEWPDRNSPSEDKVADTALKTTQAMSAYVQGNVNQLVGEREYLGQVFKKTPEEIEAISDEVDEWEELNNPPEAEEVNPAEGPSSGDNSSRTHPQSGGVSNDE